MAALAPLLDGYRRFRTGDWQRQRARWAELAEGQSPKVMVIACSDSRVDPAQIFDMPPGELFVVRNVANLVPPFEADGGHHGVSAALEFAVTQLEVSDIIVLGHGACGGVRASITLSKANRPARAASSPIGSRCWPRPATVSSPSVVRGRMRSMPWSSPGSA